MTYKVMAKENPFAQKTVSAIVPQNAECFNVFEAKIKERFLNQEVEFNHSGKVVIFK